jgi:cellulose synthase/poly-beta-1,6-N-acetylglucosamine synthase-like glycosyltransferase
MYLPCYLVLIENQALVGNVPGGLVTINAMRWILIGSTLIFSLPVISYTILFKKFHIACEVMVGAFSFLFYGPTYLNILNIYALCRIDDISWGTKGLDASGGKHSQLK